MTLLATGFETRPITMQPHYALRVQAPAEDIDRLFDVVAALTPLKHGKTDGNAYRVPGGVEYYRPLEGTPTGEETAGRQRPGVDEIGFFLPRDTGLLDQIIDALYEAHPYYEPVIIVSEVLRSATKGLDDSANPNRWWNRGGDWKEATE